MNIHIRNFINTLLYILVVLGILCPLELQAQLFGGTIISRIPTTITLGQNRKHFVVSVYDQDYWPYANPGSAATTATQAANGINESVTVNVQGAITTTGVMITIPATANGSGTLPAYSNTITIPASLTQDGIGRDLNFSWSSQSYTSQTTSVTATIKAVGGTLNAKKLDVNAGIGNDIMGILMGQFTYPYNNAGNTTTLQVRDIAAIPDRMFGLADNTGNTTSHMMLYLPILAEDGRIWLNNNLGADYANINKSGYNPAQQATGFKDYLAYGSLFQWGRKPDGHELVTFVSSTVATAVNGTTSIKSDNPTHALFIIDINTIIPNWRSTTNDNSDLWAAASANNPCPVGFKVPTEPEFTNMLQLGGYLNSSSIFESSAHKFASSGNRNRDGVVTTYTDSINYLWTSSPSISFPPMYLFGKSTTIYNALGALKSIAEKNIGGTVRCIKD
jgi:Fibrobacter succinogenes major domain (Fib_succ_major)